MSISRPIYLDHAATTPVDPAVAKRMAGCLTADGVFGNPASRSHTYGWAAERLVDEACKQVAELVRCEPREIVWTSGATESDNLAMLGAAYALRALGRHIVTGVTEHRAVLDSCAQLEREGWQVSYLAPGTNGIVTPDQVAAALRPDTVLVSIMHANNETGVLQEVAEIGDIVRTAGALFHVDAAQSAGKVPIDLARLPVDLMSLSAHKIHGPKGIGALYVRNHPAVRLLPLLHGGGQQRGLRPGTLPTHQIVGMGEAFAIAASQLTDEAARLAALRDRLWQGLAQIDGVGRNGDPLRCLPGVLNICVEGVDGEALIMALREVALSSASACASSRREPSYVLRAMGLNPAQVDGSLRLSLGRFTTAGEIERTVGLFQSAVPRLRELQRHWPRAPGTLGGDPGPHDQQAI